MDWLNSLTAAELALVVCGCFVVITLLGVVLVHPHIRRIVHGKREANEVVISAAANFGLIYAVLLGLLAVATYQTTKELEDHTSQEVESLSILYRSAEGYPEPLRSELRWQLRDYTDYVTDKAWPALRQARVLTGGDHRLQVIRRTLLSFVPTAKNQEIFHEEMLRYFNAMNVSRQERISAVSSSIPDVLWYVVFIGALITIVFIWMLHMDLMPQIILGGITALFLGLMIFVIYAMDHPLQGAVSVGPEPFRSAYNLVMKWDEPTERGEAHVRETFASVGTADINAIYYPVGRALCEIIDREIGETGVYCSPEATPGSVYNIDAIRSGELEFALVQSNIAYAAYSGKGDFVGRPFGELRSVLVLHPELITIVARRGIHKMDDLAGKRINVGHRGSGTHATWEALQTALGWKGSQAAIETRLSDDAAGSALCAGKIDAVMLVIGHPSAKVKALLAGCPSNLVPVNGPAIDSLIAAKPYFRMGRILGHLYGMKVDTPSFGVSGVLVTSASTDSKAVAAFAKVILTHIADLKTMQPVLADLDVKEMVGGRFPPPLHPAARQVYRDLGLLK